MANMILAGIQGDLYRRASELATAQQQEWLAGKAARELEQEVAMQKQREWQAQAGLRKTQSEQAQLSADEQLRLSKIAAQLQPLLSRVESNQTAAMEALHVLRPGAAKVVPAREDPQTGRTLSYNVVYPDGSVEEWTPSDIRLRSQQVFESAPTVGSTEASRLQAKQAIIDKNKETQQAVVGSVGQSTSDIYDLILKNANVHDVSYEDENGVKQTKRVDGSGADWTPEQDKAAQEEAYNAAVYGAQRYGQSGIKESTPGMLYGFRQQKQLQDQAATKRREDIAKELNQLKNPGFIDKSGMATQYLPSTLQEIPRSTSYTAGQAAREQLSPLVTNIIQRQFPLATIFGNYAEEPLQNLGEGIRGFLNPSE